MSDKISIYNMALLHVGATTVSSTDDDAKAVRVLDQFYETVRDRALADFPWNFALAQATLARKDNEPAFGFACAYQLPADCLCVVELSQAAYEYRITSGQTLECDYDDSANGADPLYLDYVKRVTDESLFPPHFIQALAQALACAIAVPMTGKASLRDALSQQYFITLADAQAADCRNNRQSTGAWNTEKDTWITGRA